MRDYPHFTNYSSLAEAVIAFGQFARANELNAGIQETLEALSATNSELLSDREYLRHGLKAIYCCNKDERETFDRIFDLFWSTGQGPIKSKTTYKDQSNITKKAKSSVVMLGQGNSSGEEKDSKNVSGANEVEKLRRTDFSKLTEIESRMLEEIAYKLWRQMSMRLKRRMKSASRGERIDLRQTIRRNVPHGGDPIDLRWRSRKPRKQRLIIMLDVSGSMDKYSFFLLRFVCALREHFEKVEAFIFSTNLIRITDYLSSRNLEKTLEVLSARANNWSSGTKIGECFRAFNEKHAKQVLNGHSTVIVLSDGLDTGKPELLTAELHKIKLRTDRVIWLNPLKGMAGYEPVQRGMSAALPEVDAFRSAHNLNSLLELEDFLIQA